MKVPLWRHLGDADVDYAQPSQGFIQTHFLVRNINKYGTAE
jgi:hypothetical protein